MIWPLNETLKLIAPYIPDQLVSAQTFAGIQTMASLLPDAMSAYYLECRLGLNVSQVDFSTCAVVSKGGREILAGYNQAVDLSPLLVQHPLWGCVREFCQDWANPASPLYAEVPFIWLEFDKMDESQPVPLPCFNFCLDPLYLEGRTLSEHALQPNTQKFQPFAEAALVGLLGRAIPPQTKQNLLTCFDLLPRGGQIIYMAVMLPRQPMALKINVSVPKDHFLEYLTLIGWSGSMVELEKILTSFCTAIDEIRFDLTVGDRISSRLGIEFFANTSSLPQNTSGRQRFLDLLVEKGSCTPEKRDALLSWSGSSSEIFSRQSWPTRLSRSWYIKLVYQANQPLEAKGYLGFAPSLFSLFSLL